MFHYDAHVSSVNGGVHVKTVLGILSSSPLSYSLSPLGTTASPLISSLQGDVNAAYTFTPPAPSSFYLSGSASQSQAIPISGFASGLSLALAASSSNLPSTVPTSGVIENGEVQSQSTSSVSSSQVTSTSTGAYTRGRSGSEAGTRSRRSDSIGELCTFVLFCFVLFCFVCSIFRLYCSLAVCSFPCISFACSCVCEIGFFLLLCLLRFACCVW